jgi:regulator of protease activity HflC (stomatin/prohibitin superfamily)
MSIGELVKQLLDWIYAFWPMRTIHDWEQGVRCLFGNARHRLTSTSGLRGTGLHFFWPWIGEIHVCDTNIEVVETDLQTQTSLDGQPVTFSMGLKYRIVNLKRMYQSIHDARETLYNEICSVAGWCAGQMEYEAIRHDLCEHVVRETKEQMGEWGIEVISLHLINMSAAQPLRLITNRAASSVQDAFD